MTAGAVLKNRNNVFAGGSAMDVPCRICACRFHAHGVPFTLRCPWIPPCALAWTLADKFYIRSGVFTTLRDGLRWRRLPDIQRVSTRRPCRCWHDGGPWPPAGQLAAAPGVSARRAGVAGPASGCMRSAWGREVARRYFGHEKKTSPGRVCSVPPTGPGRPSPPRHASGDVPWWPIPGRLRRAGRALTA
jgi:hypothetical protein